MKKLLLASIRFYQKYLSLDNGWARALWISDRVCRFTPTCSEYSFQAIEKYGIIRGLWFALCRIIRCHPFSEGGINPVP